MISGYTASALGFYDGNNLLSPLDFACMKERPAQCWGRQMNLLTFDVKANANVNGKTKPKRKKIRQRNVKFFQRQI